MSLVFEPTWIEMVLWLGLLLLTATKWKVGILPYATALIGIFVGISFVQNISLLIGVTLIFLNIGLLWHFLFKGEKTK
jgi:hypothetical protein